jgi:4-amino-4-deoxy-L-arabinose transferase-like glycosyltransferase
MTDVNAARPAEARRGAFLWLALLAGVVYLAGYDVGPPVVNAEVRCVDIARTMYATGEVLVPRLEGEPHLTKPPLFHWLSYAVSVFRGQAGIASVRLVSAGAAVGVVLLTYLLGLQLADARVAWWSALLTLGNLTLLSHGHRGTFDTLLTFFVCLTLCGYAGLWKGRTRTGYVLIVAGLIGGFMSKGFMGWVVPLLPMLVDRLGRPEPRRALRPVLCALPLVLAGSLAWYVYLLACVPTARAVLVDVVTVNFGVKRSGAEMAFHREPLYYYLYALPFALLPWLAILWPAVRQPGSGLHAWARQQRLVLAWLLGNTLLLSLVPAKAERYLVPLIPAFGLLAAPGILAIEAGTAAATARWRRWLLSLVITLGALALGVMPFWLWVRIGESVAVSILAPACLLAGLLACAWLAWRGRLLHALHGLALVILIGATPAYARWVPRHSNLSHRHDSPEHAQYRARQQQLRALFGRLLPAQAEEPMEHKPTP